MNDILTIILKDTFTLTQLKTRLKALKVYLIKEFFGGDIEQSPSDLNWLSNLPQSLYQQFTKDNVYKTFEDIEEAVHTLPVLTVYLTFEPNENSLYQIGSFVRKLYATSLLLDIKLDLNLLAGCAFVWKGVFRDYSLRAKLEEKKPEIINNFKKFLR